MTSAFVQGEDVQKALPLLETELSQAEAAWFSLFFSSFFSLKASEVPGAQRLVATRCCFPSF